MMKQEVLPTSSRKFDCRESVNPLWCNKCGFSSHVLPLLIRHKEAGCGNAVEKSNFLLDAYKCRNCEFVSCSYIITSRHETKCSMLEAATGANITPLWVCSHCQFSISYEIVMLEDEFKCGVEGCYYRYASLEEAKEHAIVVHLPDECLKFLGASSRRKIDEQIQASNVWEFTKRQVRCKVRKYKTTKCIKTQSKVLWWFCHDCRIKTKHKFCLCGHVINKQQICPVVGDIKWFERQECPCQSRTLRLFYARINNYTPRPGSTTRLPSTPRPGSTTRLPSTPKFPSTPRPPSISSTPSVNMLIFECKECPYKTKTDSHLNSHVINHHTPPEKIKWFKCDKCPYKAKTRPRLHNHKICKHTSTESIKWFACEECDYKSKLKSGLSNHRKTHLPAEKIRWFECDECEYKTKVKADLNQHTVRKHTPDEKVKWFECDECDYKSKHKNYVRTHKAGKHAVSENWFECEECPYKTRTKVVMSQHTLRKHTPSENIKWFECAQCSYKSKTKVEIRLHITRKHTAKEKIPGFECEECGYKSKSKSYLRRHKASKHSN